MRRMLVSLVLAATVAAACTSDRPTGRAAPGAPAPAGTTTAGATASASVSRAPVDMDEWCGSARALAETRRRFDAADMRDAKQIEKAFESLRAVFDVSLRNAPDAILGDVETYRIAFLNFYDAFREHEWKAEDVPRGAFELLQEKDVEDARRRIDAYNARACSL